MGGVIAKALFKNAQETVSTTAKSAWEIDAMSIDWEMINPLAKIVEGKKCVMIVNVAQNWGLAKKNY